jgi:hypothetical protein
MGIASNLAVVIGACIVGLIVSAVFNLSTDYGYLLPRGLARYASVVKPEQLHTAFHWLLALALGGMVGFLANPALVWVVVFGIVVAVWSGYLDMARFPPPRGTMWVIDK